MSQLIFRVNVLVFLRGAFVSQVTRLCPSEFLVYTRYKMSVAEKIMSNEKVHPSIVSIEVGY